MSFMDFLRAEKLSILGAVGFGIFIWAVVSSIRPHHPTAEEACRLCGGRWHMTSVNPNRPRPKAKGSHIEGPYFICEYDR